MRELTFNEVEQVSGGKVVDIVIEWVLVKILDAVTGAVTYIWERRDTTVEPQMSDITAA